MSMTPEYDVIVIGGGPAGMMAAYRASERSLRVLLIEKNKKLGKKLSITGGGRCNITNAEPDYDVFIKKYGKASRYLHATFARFGVNETMRFFESHALPLVIQDKNRVFPKSENAEDVTQLMSLLIHNKNITIKTNTPVVDVELRKDTLVGVVTRDRTYTAHAYIFACGGKSRPETGSTGDAIPWARKMGHTVHEPNPDLVPLVVRDLWIRNMSGSTLSGVCLRAECDSKKIKIKGDILCTHFGISGPTILNNAKRIRQCIKNGELRAELDLYPEKDVGTLRQELHNFLSLHANKTIKNALTEFCGVHIAHAILETFSSEVAVSKSHSITREVRHKIVDMLKCMQITITGTMGLDWAIVSDGGVDLNEIDTRTMRSKICKNVYFVGDMLHIERPSGGYSLQLCWTTGWVAGDSACVRLEA